MFNVGLQLRKTRKRNNLTLDQLAASSGVDRGTISRIELGHVSPRIDTIGFLCQAMNTNLSHFFGTPEATTDLEAANVRLSVSYHPDGVNGQGDPLPEEGAPRLDFALPIEAGAKPLAEGYWPVPSTFWRGLLEVLERFEILVKNSREMILVNDRAGKILYTSPPCEEILGVRPQDLVGQSFQALMHPEDLPAYEHCLDALLLSPGTSQDLDFRMRCKHDAWCLMTSKLTNQLDNPNVRAVVLNAMKFQTALSR